MTNDPFGGASMSDPAACLNEHHIEIPEHAVAIMYVKAKRPGTYNAVAFTTLENFAGRGARYVAKMVECVELDSRAECRLCGQVFDAHTKEDVSALKQRNHHYKVAHS